MQCNEGADEPERHPVFEAEYPTKEEPIGRLHRRRQRDLHCGHARPASQLDQYVSKPAPLLGSLEAWVIIDPDVRQRVICETSVRKEISVNNHRHSVNNKERKRVT